MSNNCSLLACKATSQALKKIQLNQIALSKHMICRDAGVKTISDNDRAKYNGIKISVFDPKEKGKKRVANGKKLTFNRFSDHRRTHDRNPRRHNSFESKTSPVH